MKYGLLSLTMLVALLLVAGCGFTTHPVKGNVSYDGAPLPEGDIVFRPNDKSLPPQAGKIKNGQYKVFVRPGSYKIEVRASKLMPLPEGTKGAMGETEAHQDYIGAKYNENTELSADVTGPADVNFELKSN